MCVLRLLFMVSFILFSIWYSVLELCFRCYDPFDNGYDRFSEHDDRLNNGYAFYNEHGPGGGMAGPGQAGLSQLDPAWLGWATGRAGLAPAGFGRAPAAPRLGRPGPSRAPAGPRPLLGRRLRLSWHSPGAQIHRKLQSPSGEAQ